MAINKSKKIAVLFHHLLILAATMIVSSMTLGFSFWFGLLWIAVNLICHGIQDWFIWRIAGIHLMKSCKIKEEIYNSKFFWDVVGIDGFLHYSTYFISYWFISKM
jgi:hypothetical protein